MIALFLEIVLLMLMCNGEYLSGKLECNLTYCSSTAPLTVTTQPSENHTAFNGTEIKLRILTHASIITGVHIGPQVDHNIIFPTSQHNDFFYSNAPDFEGISKCTDNYEYCEHFDSYPKTHIDALLRRQHTVNRDFFGVEQEPAVLADRLGDDQEISLCESTQRTYFPKVAKNDRNEWKFIINQGANESNQVQGVRIEVCKRKKSACTMFGELPEGYSTECQQKYVYRKLLYLSEHNRIETDSFELPSACCCSYKRSFDIVDRLGFSGGRAAIATATATAPENNSGGRNPTAAMQRKTPFISP